MSDKKRRLSKLEKDAGGDDDLPWLTLKQSLDDPEIYSDADGKRYKKPFDAFDGLYNLIVVEYEKSEEDDDGKGIQLKWPEDL